MPIAVCVLKDSLAPTARPIEMTVLQHPAEMEPLAQWVNKKYDVPAMVLSALHVLL